MDIITKLLIMLFILKLVWNILTPWVAHYQMIMWKKGGKPPQSLSISFAPIIEIVLLLFITMGSFFSNAKNMFSNSGVVFIYGLAAIFVSYMLAFILAFIIRTKKNT